MSATSIPCTIDSPADEPAARLYAAYNRGGDASTAGLNYQGKPCPVWEGLPPNVRLKWREAAAFAARLYGAG